MGRRSGLDVRVAAALVLLLLGAPAAAAQSEGEMRRAVRAALDRGDLSGARKLIADALGRFGTRDTEPVWALRVMEGEALVGAGEASAARQALDFTLPAKYRNSDTAVRQLIVQMYTVDRAAALEIGARARELAAAHVPAALADVLVAIANMSSDRARAEDLAREAIRASKKNGTKLSQTKALATLAQVLNLQQKFGEAVPWGEQAVSLARSGGFLKTLQQAQGNLGWSYFELGDYETAADLFTSAEATAARIGAKRDRVPWLIQLGNIRAERRDWQGAKRFTEQAVILGRQTQHRQLAYAIANLARIAMATGDFGEARRLNNEALQHRGGDLEGQLRSKILEAQILIVENRHDDAQKLLGEVMRDTKDAMTRAEAGGRLAQSYVRTHKPQQAEEQFRKAIAAAREAHADVTDTALRLSLAHTTAEIFGEYVDFLVRSKRVEDALHVTETRRAQLLEEGLTVPAKLDARAVARQNDATILCYWLGRARSYLWVVTKAGVALHELQPDTTIEKVAEDYRKDLQSPERGLLSRSGPRGAALYDLLVAPAAAAIPKGSRVIVVADGKLHALNFETLVVPSPQRYWIEDVVVMNASSLQLLARAARKPANGRSMLLVGNTPEEDPAFPPLANAAKEMRLIEKRFPRRTVLKGAKATPAAYEAAPLEKFDYVHFVAHGEAIQKRPLDSAVILARDASSRYKLLARDVAGSRRLTAQLVTISSCESAGMRTYPGEGVVGLAWAFLRAGADQVIASLWKVNDAATPQLMDRMYEGIGAGKDPAVALRDAKLHFVRGTGPNRRPKYWAPFVLYAGT